MQKRLSLAQIRRLRLLGAAGANARKGPVDLPHAALLAAAAVALFAGSWGLIHRGFFTRNPIRDTPVYQRYGSDMVDGEVPYRDFRPEYPPAALPTFVLPALGKPSESTYESRFGWEMLACGAAMIVLMAAALAALGAGSVRTAAALGFAGISPLLIGPVILTRFDLWPAALSVGALAAILSGRLRLGAGLAGLGFAAKVYPGLLLPLALAYAWRRSGRREALVCAGVFAAVAAVWIVPFAAIAPHGLWSSVFNQGNRPLQIESLGSAVMLVAHHLFGLGVTVESTHGSQNLAGSGAGTVAALQFVAQALAVVAVWVWFARGPATRERLVRFAALAVAVFVALGKVLSPQFLIWLIPLVPLVRGRRGLAAAGVLTLALLLTQAWFPYRYWSLARHLDGGISTVVLVRDLVLLGLVAVLAWPRRGPAER